LAAAYLKYANRLGLSAELLDSFDGHIALKMSGRGVWRAFCHESGKHVVQRVPPTERSGRRQTSVVAVSILPIFEQKASPLPDADIEIMPFSSGGPGGQHRNRKKKAIRMRHKPTGIQSIVATKDRQYNLKEARKILTARVNMRKLESHRKDYDESRKQQWGGGGRTGKIRTYNFIESRVTDHRTGRKTRAIDLVMRGQIDLILPA